MKYKSEIEKRRTFAIISHPDAGKTTLTEKFLLFGGAIQTAGAVKSNKIRKHATSDFMEIERQRGPDPRVVAGMLGAGALAGLWLLLRGRRRATPLIDPAAADAGPDPVVLGPYEAALARLSQIERERWPMRGEVDRHYEAVADVVRRYLEEAHGIPALERNPFPR